MCETQSLSLCDPTWFWYLQFKVCAQPEKYLDVQSAGAAATKYKKHLFMHFYHYSDWVDVRNTFK